MDIPSTDLFQWHVREDALERLNPLWRPRNVIRKNGGLRNIRAEISMRITPED